MKLSAFFLVLLTFCSVKCTTSVDERRQSRPLFTLRSPDATGVHFSNQLYETTDLNIITYEYMYNGAGVTDGDNSSRCRYTNRDFSSLARGVLWSGS